MEHGFFAVWQLVDAYNDGVRTPDEIAERFQFRMLPDRVQVVVEDETVLMEATLSIDTSSSPAEATVQLPDGNTILGIMKIEDGMLVSCVGQPDGPRPTEFSSEPGSGQSLRFLKRVRDI